MTTPMVGVLRTMDVLLLQAVARGRVSWLTGWFAHNGQEMDLATGTRLARLLHDGYVHVVDRTSAISAIVITDRGAAGVADAVPDVDAVLAKHNLSEES